MATTPHGDETERDSIEPEGYPLTHETAFQRDLLFAIAYLNHSDAGEDENGQTHGLGIKTFLENYYEKELNHGRLYPNLDDLVDRGLVRKGEADRRTNTYALNARGRHELERHTVFEQTAVDAIDTE